MNSTTQTLSPLRQRFLDDMRMRKLAPKTQSGYLRTVSRFYGWLKRSPDTATAEDLRRYQMYLVDHGMSAISLNSTITGLKFFFTSWPPPPTMPTTPSSVHDLRLILGAIRYSSSPCILPPRNMKKRVSNLPTAG